MGLFWDLVLEDEVVPRTFTIFGNLISLELCVWICCSRQKVRIRVGLGLVV